MKGIKRVFTAILFLAAILSVIGYFLIYGWQVKPLPDYSTDVYIPNLKSNVRILRDSFAIPHIIADNEIDLYKAVGFVMAQDRLWQMDLLRRVTQGRLSEIFGEELLKTDLLMRSLQIEEKSKYVLENSLKEVVVALKAFSEGVNYYLQSCSLPPEFRILGYKPEMWKPIHSVNLICYMSWDLTSGWNMELLIEKLRNELSDKMVEELLPYQENYDPVFSDFTNKDIYIGDNMLSANSMLEKLGVEVFQGSNNWAVAGEKSVTGKPILANDMHLGLFSPGIWYQIHQIVKDSINVTGLALPGQPFVICGHNDSIAWGMTNVMVDDIDFYVETLNKDSTKYLLNGKWEDLKIMKEVFYCRKGNCVEEKIKFTHRGPIVNKLKEERQKPISIRWIGNEKSNEMRTVFLLNRANNWREFRLAVETFKSVSQNIVYADVKGNIGMQTCAGVPIRNEVKIGVYPGDTTWFDWKGLVPFEELPYEFNPERGYVSSANNKTVDGNYKYYIGKWFAMPYRINRIREMLEEKEKCSVNDFMRMQGDVKSKMAEKINPLIVKAIVNEKNWGKIHEEVIRKLKVWDYVMDRKAVAPAVFEVMYWKIAENIIKDDVSDELFEKIIKQKIIINNLMENVFFYDKKEWIDNKETKQKEELNDIIIISFRQTVNELKGRFGENVEKWQWGRLHNFTLRHPLGEIKFFGKMLNFNRGPFPMKGSFHTVCPYSYSYDEKYNVTHGASHRNIFDLEEWDNSMTVIPTGTNGMPGSNFYLDQTKLYLNNGYHNDRFEMEKIEEEKEFEMMLLRDKR